MLGWEQPAAADSRKPHQVLMPLSAAKAKPNDLQASQEATFWSMIEEIKIDEPQYIT